MKTSSSQPAPRYLAASIIVTIPKIIVTKLGLKVGEKIKFQITAGKEHEDENYLQIENPMKRELKALSKQFPSMGKLL